MKYRIFILFFILSVVLITIFPIMGESGESAGKFAAFDQKKPELVLIPTGEFIMGRELTDDGKSSRPRYIDYYPHKVHVDSFYMDKYEVTNAQYYLFCKETNTPLPVFWGIDKFRSGLKYPDHPVIGVGQGYAKKYAEWRGMRLPTEAEWEYAGRGGLVGKNYPLNDDLKETDANFGQKNKGPVKVGSYPPNGFGLHDMAGNVREWTSDYYDKDYYTDSPYKNPQGPEIGKHRVLRGGGWFSGKSCCKVYRRWSLPTYWVDINVGFRCVRDVKKEEKKKNTPE